LASRKWIATIRGATRAVSPYWLLAAWLAISEQDKLATRLGEHGGPTDRNIFADAPKELVWRFTES